MISQGGNKASNSGPSKPEYDLVALFVATGAAVLLGVAICFVVYAWFTGDYGEAVYAVIMLILYLRFVLKSSNERR
jgi:Flp pilus assembly protein TadB